MRQILLACATMLGFAAPALAGDAHPAMWTVHGPKGTVVLVSSLHLLPRGTDWHRPEIDAAMAHADSFVFEVPTGDGELNEETQFIFDKGLLFEFDGRVSGANISGNVRIAGAPPAPVSGQRAADY